MSGSPRPISEEDLHAFVDGQLTPARRAEVLEYLQGSQEDAARVAAWTAQREALRAALAAHAERSVPAYLDPRVMLRQQRAQRTLAWRAAAAVLLALGLGGGGGWFLRGQANAPPADIQILMREAVANHVVYTADKRRPTELGENQREDLARWVSNRLNHKVTPPDLTDSGFRYMGGRLAATPEGPAGMFMYQNTAGVRLTVFVRPDAHARNAPIVPIDSKPVGGAAWIEKGIGYTVVAPVPTDELRRIAEQVQRILNARA
ncbi:MAG: anti-sigma factor [Acetobacteraceae bacterium]